MPMRKDRHEAEPRKETDRPSGPFHCPTRTRQRQADILYIPTPTLNPVAHEESLF